MFIVSVVSFLIIGFLIYSEFRYYLDSKFTFKFSPDVELSQKLKINIDITIAMPCQSKQFSLKFDSKNLIYNFRFRSRYIRLD